MPQRSQLFKSVLAGGAAATLADAYLAYDQANLTAYWPLVEPSGATADNKQGSAALDGTYHNVTLNAATFGGLPVGLWTSASPSYCNIPAAALASALNETLFTLQAWVRVANSGVWTNGNAEDWVCFKVDTNNDIRFTMAGNVGNRCDMRYRAGGTSKTAVVTSLTTTDWMHWVMTVDKANDRVRLYLNGAKQGADLTGLGVWAGTLADCNIGANTSTSTLAANAYLAHVAIWNVEMTLAQVGELYALPN